MIDPPREEVFQAVADANSAGIQTVMITGDHKTTAVAIAKEIGIFQRGDLALTGAELDQLSEAELTEQLEQITVYARVSPENKIRIVRAWQDKGKISAMTGDGVNDAPALKQADIGIAMGNNFCLVISQQINKCFSLMNSANGHFFLAAFGIRHNYSSSRVTIIKITS